MVSQTLLRGHNEPTVGDPSLNDLALGELSCIHNRLDLFFSPFFVLFLFFFCSFFFSFCISFFLLFGVMLFIVVVCFFVFVFCASGTSRITDSAANTTHTHTRTLF